MKISKNIKRARRSLDLTAKQIADEINTTPQTISNIESKKNHSKTFQYLIFLRKRGIDINTIFENQT